MSSKEEARSICSSTKAISLIPGESMISAPLGKIWSERDVVVCLPFESLIRTDFVFCTFCFNSELTIVDFPTPDDPISEVVSPKIKSSRRFSHSLPLVALIK